MAHDVCRRWEGFARGGYVVGLMFAPSICKLYHDSTEIVTNALETFPP